MKPRVQPQRITRGPFIICYVLGAIAGCFATLTVVGMQPKQAAVRFETVAAPLPSKPLSRAVAALPVNYESALDGLKQRYEKQYVNYLLLTRCQLATPADGNAIGRALSREAQALDAPPGFTQNVVIAAQGTYEAMYSVLPCSDASVKRLSASFSSYIRKLD